MRKLFIFISVISINIITATGSYGEQYWAKTYSWGMDETTSCIQQTSDGGYIVGGTQCIPMPLCYISVLKLDSSGDIVWQKTYGDVIVFPGLSIQQTSEGGYIAASRSGVGYGPIWVLKLDGSGGITW